MRLRLALVLTILVCIPLVVLLWTWLEMAASPGVRSAWSSMLRVGIALLAVGVVGVGAWQWSGAFLDPIAQLAAWVRRAGTGSEGASAPSLPMEVDGVRQVVQERFATDVRRATQRSLQVAAVVHDMKTPLLAIRRSLGFARDFAASEAGASWCDAAVEETDRLLELVRDVSLIDQLDRGVARVAVESIDLGGLARQVAERVAIAFPKVRLEADTRRFDLDGDANLLTRALENVMSNAFRHARGVVRVDVTPGLVRVADDGEGMPDHVANLFAARLRSAAPREPMPGTNLGLFVAATMLEAHGGRLVVEGTGRTGSAVLLYVGVARATVRV